MVDLGEVSFVLREMSFIWAKRTHSSPDVQNKTDRNKTMFVAVGEI